MRLNVVTVVALIAGFAGGALSQQLVRPAHATPVLQQVVIARDFRLVDDHGNVIAELRPSKTRIFRAELHITGYNGHVADLGATNLIFGARTGGELGLGYVEDRKGNPTNTAIFIEEQGHPRMDIDANGPAITLYGARSKITLFGDEAGKNKLWSAP